LKELKDQVQQQGQSLAEMSQTLRRILAVMSLNHANVRPPEEDERRSAA